MTRFRRFLSSLVAGILFGVAVSALIPACQENPVQPQKELLFNLGDSARSDPGPSPPFPPK